MRLIFLGSGEFGLPTLADLHARHQILAVVSQPDRPAGRRQHLTPTPIAAWALAQGLPVHRHENANDPDVVAQLRELRADAAVVIAFGQKLHPPLIAACGRLAVNLHASLLPRYRGAAPINWAILKGEIETGVSVIGLAERMDAGLVYARQATRIDPLETAGELHDRLALMGPAAVGEVLDAFAAGTLRGEVQDESQATRAPKLSRADATVDLAADVDQVAARVMGLNPWPGVRVTWRQGGPDGPAKELLLRRVAAEPDASCFINPRHQPAPGQVLDGHRVTVGNGTIRLLEVQVPGGRALPIEEFIRGHPLRPGDVLAGVIPPP